MSLYIFWLPTWTVYKNLMIFRFFEIFDFFFFWNFLQKKIVFVRVIYQKFHNSANFQTQKKKKKKADPHPCFQTIHHAI